MVCSDCWDQGNASAATWLKQKGSGEASSHGPLGSWTPIGHTSHFSLLHLQTYISTLFISGFTLSALHTMVYCTWNFISLPMCVPDSEKIMCQPCTLIKPPSKMILLSARSHQVCSAAGGGGTHPKYCTLQLQHAGTLWNALMLNIHTKQKLLFCKGQ